MNEELFTGKADNYDKYRASYPSELVDWLYEKTAARTVADIGAGTGKFTACLMEKPWKITAVEPNEDMLGKLRVNAPRAEIIGASAENTEIPSHSIDLVTAATAFHWFDEAKFKAECVRILTPNGRLAVIFNGKVADELVVKRDEISRVYCGYKGHAGVRSNAEGEAFLRNEYLCDTEYTEFMQSVSYDEEAFLGNSLSRSYALKPENDRYEEYVRELKKLFDSFSRNGTVELKYKTTCCLGRLRRE